MAHRYTAKELRGGGEVTESPRGDGQFCTIVYSYAYRHGCGGESVGAWCFDHKLHALQSLAAQNRELAEEELSDDEFAGWEAEVEEAVRTIRRQKSDDGVMMGVVNFDGNNGGLIVVCSGYWDEFVPEALDYFIDERRKPRDDGWDEEDDDDVGADERETADAGSDSDREELAALEALKARADIHAPDFIEAFTEACDAFDRWKNG